MEFDNPAGRLLDVLKEGKDHSNDQKCRDVWHKLLRTEGHESQLMSGLGKVMTLPQLAIEALVEHYPAHLVPWTHWNQQVMTAFASQQLHSSWQTFNAHIDDHTLNYLANSAILLDNKTGTKKIDQEKLLEFRTTVNALIEEVLNAKLPKELRFFLVKSLKQIIEAIDDYRLTGAMPILDALGSTVGHSAFNSNYYEFLKETPLGKRIVEAIGAMANVVTVATGYTQLAPPATALLLSFAGP